MTKRLVRAAPLLVAALLAYVFDAGAIGLGAALGIGAFLALLIARKPMPAKFGALSLAGAVAFGFIAAVLASLHGMSVQNLMASDEAAHQMARSIGVAAVMLAVLGAACLAWSTILGRPPNPDD